jgi:hypothetical protein
MTRGLDGGDNMDKPQMESLLVVIPSRLKHSSSGELFLEKAINSILSQRAANRIKIDIAVGVDPGASYPQGAGVSRAEFFTASSASQAAALNAAAHGMKHDLIAILEDDDEWAAEFLGTALAALEQTDFVSSTQLEIDTEGRVICINDFPTPSGWIMRRNTWATVGGFDETYRHHLDNEWLGRLALSKLRRIHLIEATAPLDYRHVAAKRPWLGNVLTNGGSNVRLVRHAFLLPMIRRLVHSESGSAQIGIDASDRATSEAEYKRLVVRFGRIPW